METMTSVTSGAIGNGVTPSTNTVAAAPAPGTPATLPPAGKARVAVSFLQVGKDSDLLVDSARILTMLTGNPAYPTPEPTLAVITTARNSFAAAVTAARDSRIGVKARVQQRANLVALLRTLAHDVQMASGGDLPTLLSSGFPAQRTRAPVGELPAPANLRLSRGKVSGQVIARCDRIERAGAYLWRYALSSTPTTWLQVVTTVSAKAVFTSLAPTASYLAQVSVVGSAGQGNWSDVATVTVL
jgi:hypothetical protein